MRRILRTLGCDDMEGLGIWEAGASFDGSQPATGIFERIPRQNAEKKIREVVRRRSDWVQHPPRVSGHRSQDIWQLATQRTLHQFDGPWTAEQVPFPDWASGVRFVKEEEDKLRDIDDKSGNGSGVNATVSFEEKPPMPGLMGALDLFQTVLTRWPDSNLLAGAEDCDAAFSTIPLRSDEKRPSTYAMYSTLSRVK